MRNYIILNGQNSNSISGLLIQSLAPISKPLMRTETEEIDGRDGDITTKLGYSAYDKEITIGLYGNYDINEVIAYFNSEGTVIFSNEPDKYYNYQIAAQIDFERLVRYKTATVTMHCQPFKYSATEGTEIFGASSNLVTIPNFSRTTNGITVTVSNGLMTISGKGSAATEFYVPIDTLSLAAGSYTMTAVGSGTAPEACSLRVIYDSPSSANSFGGGYVTLKNNTDVSLSATLTATKTYNYVYLYITGGKNMNFTLNLQIVDQAQAVVSDEGTNLVLENTAEAPFSQFDLKGNTEQDGTPTPSAPVPVQTVTGGNVVKICGKNLINLQTGEVRGITCTQQPDGGYLLSGTASGGIAQFIFDITLNDTLHTVSYTSNMAFSGVYLRTRTWKDTATGAIQDQLQVTSTSGSVTSSKSFGQVTLTIADNATVPSGFIIYPQLELGSSASSFEPYQEQSYEVNLGKNLFDKNNYDSLNAYVNGSTITASVNNEIVWIPCEPDTAYAITVVGSSVSTGVYSAPDIPVAGGTANWIGSIAAGDTTGVFTTKPTAKYIVVRIWTNTASQTVQEALDALQIEKGSQATSYAPYFTPIELCKIGDYRDYIWNDNGTWKKHKAVNKAVLNGNEESWQIEQSGMAGYFYRCNLSQDTSVSENIYALYSNYGVAGNVRLTTTNEGIAIFNNNHLRIRYGAETSLDNWKAKLTATNMILYYPITPTDETITNSALIAQLDDIYYHAHAYKERTHVSSTYADGNVPHIIAAAVAANMGNITVTNSGNFISKPTMTIFGSGDIGVYLNGIQLFQIALGDTEYITIDCAAMEAYKDTLETLQNRLVTGDYSNFVLNPGDNTISFTGSVTKFEISNYSRWL